MLYSYLCVNHFVSFGGWLLTAEGCLAAAQGHGGRRCLLRPSHGLHWPPNLCNSCDGVPAALCSSLGSSKVGRRRAAADASTDAGGMASLFMRRHPPGHLLRTSRVHTAFGLLPGLRPPVRGDGGPAAHLAPLTWALERSVEGPEQAGAPNGESPCALAGLPLRTAAPAPRWLP